MQKYNKGVPHRDICLFLFGKSVTAEGFSFALGTSSALPDTVEVVGGGIHQRWFVGEDFGLEVAVVVAFHAYAGTCEVGGADVGFRAVENHYLEMHPWAESPLQPAPQPRIFVEVLAEVLARFFGVQQTNVDTALEQLVENREERHYIPSSLHIQVLQVGCTNPQIVLDFLTKCQHLCVMFFVCDILEHGYFDSIIKPGKTTTLFLFLYNHIFFALPLFCGIEYL